MERGPSGSLFFLCAADTTAGLFFSNGRHLTREYPRLTPNGAQVDLFESMDIENGLIVYHRVYWGWQGLKALLTVRDRRT